MARKTRDEEEKLRVMDAIAKQKQDAESAPSIIAYTMKKEPGKSWLFVEYEIKNGKVVNETTKECMDKDHAIETYKLAFVHTFIQGK